MKISGALSIACGIVGSLLISCGGDDGVQTLSSTGGPTAAMTIDSGYAYWTIAGDPTASPAGMVMRVPVNGGAASTLASTQSFPFDIAVDGSDVFWINRAPASASPAVMKLSLLGGDPTVLYSGAPGPTHIAIDSQNVYWTNAFTNTVMQIPRAGGVAVTLASGQIGATGIALDATNVYWTAPQMQAVMTTPKGGGTVITLAHLDPEAASYPEDLVVDGDVVYWGDDDFVAAVSVKGGTPKILATGSWCTARLALDATSLYWTDACGGQVLKAPRSGGSAQRIAFGSEWAPDGIAVDATSVYWTTSDGVMKHSK